MAALAHGIAPGVCSEMFVKVNAEARPGRFSTLEGIRE
jgi:hypothetical protein